MDNILLDVSTGRSVRNHGVAWPVSSGISQELDSRSRHLQNDFYGFLRSRVNADVHILSAQSSATPSFLTGRQEEGRSEKKDLPNDYASSSCCLLHSGLTITLHCESNTGLRRCAHCCTESDRSD